MYFLIYSINSLCIHFQSKTKYCFLLRKKRKKGNGHWRNSFSLFFERKLVGCSIEVWFEESHNAFLLLCCSYLTLICAAVICPLSLYLQIQKKLQLMKYQNIRNGNNKQHPLLPRDMKIRLKLSVKIHTHLFDFSWMWRWVCISAPKQARPIHWLLQFAWLGLSTVAWHRFSSDVLEWHYRTFCHQNLQLSNAFRTYLCPSEI